MYKAVFGTHEKKYDSILAFPSNNIEIHWLSMTQFLKINQ
jgi:hypothetical protein